MIILYNHIGYDTKGPKRALLEFEKEVPSVEAFLVDRFSGETVLSLNTESQGAVSGWKDRFYFSMDFSDFCRPGVYQIASELRGNMIVSDSFEIRDNLFLEETLSDILSWFKTMRSSGMFDRADRNAGFFENSAKHKDLHGGWYDASGDTSKYLSHLSYANYMNPQQIPLVVWGLLEGLENLKKAGGPEYGYLKNRAQEESLWGADFLVRMQDPDGFFYMTLFDQWSKDLDKRIVSAFSGQDGKRSADYQAGYRQGGGMAVAALARCSLLEISGDYSSEKYLETAKTGFYHLEENSIRYLDDGKENIIDDYCALLAACELYNACAKKASGNCGCTPEETGIFKSRADARILNLTERLTADGKYTDYLSADGTGEIPFFHASDAGMPVYAAFRYLEVFPDSKQKERVIDFIKRSLGFELEITCETVNPFGYARQYVRPLSGEKRSSFFFPHDNWSGYWWQGENARLASLSSAAFRGAELFKRDIDLSGRLFSYGVSQLDWVLGKNPFDVCMLHGKGRNNPEYERSLPNFPGGIVNGITGGLSDEADIDFLPAGAADDGKHRWRWAEQWLPHAAWFFIAVCAFPRGVE